MPDPKKQVSTEPKGENPESEYQDIQSLYRSLQNYEAEKMTQKTGVLPGTDSKYIDPIDVYKLDKTAPDYEAKLENIKAANQSFLDKAGNGVVKALGSTAGSLGKGLVALPYGILSAMTGQGLDKVIDNDIYTAINKSEEALNKAYPLYQSEEEKKLALYDPRKWVKGNFFADQVLGTASMFLSMSAMGFAASKAVGLVGDAASLFGEMASAGKTTEAMGAFEKYIASELGQEGKAGEELFNAIKGVDPAKKADVFSKAISEARKVVGKLTPSQQTVSGAVSGTAFAAMDAQQEKNSKYNEFKSQLDRQYGIQTGDDFSIEDLKRLGLSDDKIARYKDAEDNSIAAMHAKFVLNSVAFTGLNLVNLSRMLTPYKAEVSNIVNGVERSEASTALDEVFESAKGPETKLGRVAESIKQSTVAKHIGSAAVLGVELGVYDKSINDYYTRKFEKPSVDWTDNFMQAVGHGFSETLGTSEGWSGIFNMSMMGIMSGTLESGMESEQREAKDAYKKQAIDIANSNNLRPVLEDIVRQHSIDKELDKANKEQDQFTSKNLANDKLKSFISSRVDIGKYDEAIENLKKYRDMDKNDFYNEMGWDKNKIDVDHRKYIDNLLDKAKEIKSVKENIDTRFHYAPAEIKEMMFSHVIDIKDRTERAQKLEHDLSLDADTHATGKRLIETLLNTKSTPEQITEADEEFYKATSLSDYKYTEQNAENIVNDLYKLHLEKQRFVEAYSKIKDEKSWKNYTEEVRKEAAENLKTQEELKKQKESEAVKKEEEAREKQTNTIVIPTGWEIMKEGEVLDPDKYEPVLNYKDTGINYKIPKDVVEEPVKETKQQQQEDLSSPEDLQSLESLMSKPNEFKVDKTKKPEVNFEDKINKSLSEKELDELVNNNDLDDDTLKLVAKKREEIREVSTNVNNPHHIDDSDIKDQVKKEKKSEVTIIDSGTQKRTVLDSDGKYLINTLAYLAQEKVEGANKTKVDANGNIIPNKNLEPTTLLPEHWNEGEEILLSIDTKHEKYEGSNVDTMPVLIELKNKVNTNKVYLHDTAWAIENCNESIVKQIQDIRSKLKVGDKISGKVISKSSGPLNIAEDANGNVIKKDIKGEFVGDNRVVFAYQGRDKMYISDESKRSSIIEDNTVPAGAYLVMVPSANGKYKMSYVYNSKLSESKAKDDIVKSVSKMIEGFVKNNLSGIGVTTENQLKSEINKYFYTYETKDFNSVKKENKLSLYYDDTRKGLMMALKSDTSNYDLFVIREVGDKIDIKLIKGTNEVESPYKTVNDLLQEKLADKQLNLTQNLVNKEQFDHVVYEDGELKRKQVNYVDFLQDYDIAKTPVQRITVTDANTGKTKFTYTTQPVIEIGGFNFDIASKDKELTSINQSYEGKKIVTDLDDTLIKRTEADNKGLDVKDADFTSLGFEIKNKIKSGDIKQEDIYVVTASDTDKQVIIDKLGINNVTPEWINEHIKNSFDGVTAENKDTFSKAIEGDKLFLDDRQDVLDSINDKSATKVKVELTAKELEDLKDLGITEEDINNIKGTPDLQELSVPKVIKDVDKTSLSSYLIPGLEYSEQQKIIDSATNSVIDIIDNHNTGKKSIVGFEGKVISLDQALDKFYSDLEKYAEVLGESKQSNLIKKVLDYKDVKVEDNELISRIGVSNLIKWNIKQLKFDLLVGDDDPNNVNKNEDRGRDDKKNLATNTEDSMSARQKKMLQSIEKTINGKRVYNQLGLRDHYEYQKVFLSLSDILSDTKIEDMMSTLDRFGKHNELYVNVSKKLQELQPHELNEFYTTFKKQTAKYKLLKIEELKDGSIYSRLMEPNRNGAKHVIFDKWHQLFNTKAKQLGLISVDENGFEVVNTEAGKSLLKTYENASNEESFDKVSEVFNSIGLDVKPEALQLYYENEFAVKGSMTKKTFLNENIKYIFDSLAGKYSSEKIGEAFEKSNPFYKQSGYIEKLAMYNNIVDPTTYSSSFVNANGDLLYAYVNSNNLSDLTVKLLNDEQYFKDLSSCDFQSTSTILKDLNDEHDPKRALLTKKHFGVYYLDASKGDSIAKNYDEQSAIEKQISRVNFYINGSNTSGISLFLTPTLADKTNFVMMQCIRRSLLKEVSGGKITVSEDRSKPVIFSTESSPVKILSDIVRGEIKRINSTIEQLNTLPKDKLMDNAEYGKHFFLFPSINDLPLKRYEKSIEKDGSIIFHAGQIIDSIENMDMIKEEIKSILEKDTKAKLDKFEKVGLFEYDKNNVFKHKVSSEYFNTIGKDIPIGGDMNMKKMAYLAADYKYNSILAHINMIQLYHGDPAKFAKLEKGKENTAFNVVSNTMQDFFKRSAKDLAPGTQSNFDSSHMNVLFINEPKITSKLVSKESELGRVVKEYSGLELADAQSWITKKEAVRRLFSNGQIDKQTYDNLIDKCNKNQRFTDQEAKDVLQMSMKPLGQPSKPVYVNGVMNKETRSRDEYYIKTSSFPLLDELTSGETNIELDKLRQLMESSNVDMAVVKSGVKLGFHKGVDLFDNEGGINPSDISNNIHTLPRDGFRIQQDVPYHDKDTTITDSTQFRKKIFDDLDQSLNFDLNNKKYKGHELKQQASDIYVEKYRRKLELFKEQIGVNESGRINDVNKLQKTLIDEAINQGFSINDLLMLSTIDYQNNTLFDIPLLFHPLSRKIESLLNASIKNNVLKSELPGLSCVQGSSVGFKFDKTNVRTSTEGISQINWTGKHDGKNLSCNKDDKGLYAEVLLPFHFKQNGKRLDVNKFKDGLSDELLESIGFRIPYQGSNSSMRLKVVGFLPESMGDLVIVPAEFTKQMGSDFDVDKLYIYTKNYVVEGDKISKVNYISGKDKASTKKRYDQLKEDYIKAHDVDFAEYKERYFDDPEFKAEHEDDSEAKLLSTIFSDRIKSDFINENGLISYEEFAKLPYMEQFTNSKMDNMLYDIHDSVMRNKDVLKKSLNPNDTKPLKETRDAIIKRKLELDKNYLKNRSGYYNNGLINDDYNEYVQSQFNEGKVGIAMMSNHSTGHTMFQHAGIFIPINLTENGNDISTCVMFKDNNGKIYTDNTLGNNTDNHLYDNHKTLGAWRLDKINGFDGTPISLTQQYIQSASVDCAKDPMLTDLNLNKDTFGVAGVIARSGFNKDFIGWFLTQPAILDYIKELNSASNFTSKEFITDEDKSVIAFKKVSEKYEKFGEAKNRVTPFSLSELQEYNKEYQHAMLKNFIEWDKLYKNINKLERSLNPDTKGLDKSLYSSVLRVNKFNDDFENSKFGNTNNLLYTKNGAETQEYAAFKVMKSSVNMLSDSNVLPISHENVNYIFESISKFTNVDNLSEKKAQNIISSIKSAFYSKFALDSKLTNPENKTSSEIRNELLFGKDSLAKLITELQLKGTKNSFINSLKSNISGDTSKPDTIEYAISKSMREELSVPNTLAFEDLVLSDKGTLESKIGQKLLQYTFLLHNENNVKDFDRYLSSDLLKHIGFGEHLRSQDLDDLNKDLFIKQWFQNNSNQASRIDKSDIKSIDGDNIILKEKVDSPFFQYDNELYIIKDNMIYTKINKLGNEMYNEYDLSKSKLDSSFNKNIKQAEPIHNQLVVEEKTIQDKPELPVDKHGYKEGGSLFDVLDSIKVKSDNEYNSKLSEIIRGQSNLIKDVNIFTHETGEFDDRVNQVVGSGGYYLDHKLSIDPEFRAKDGDTDHSRDDDFEVAVLHESLHAILDEKLKRRINKTLDLTSIKALDKLDTMLPKMKEVVLASPEWRHIADTKMNDIDEVFALFSNREFTELFRGVKYEGGTFLQKICATLRMLFGIDGKDDLFNHYVDGVITLLGADTENNTISDSNRPDQLPIEGLIKTLTTPVKEPQLDPIDKTILRQKGIVDFLNKRIQDVTIGKYTAEKKQKISDIRSQISSIENSIKNLEKKRTNEAVLKTANDQYRQVNEQLSFIEKQSNKKLSEKDITLLSRKLEDVKAYVSAWKDINKLLDDDRDSIFQKQVNDVKSSYDKLNNDVLSTSALLLTKYMEITHGEKYDTNELRSKMYKDESWWKKMFFSLSNTSNDISKIAHDILKYKLFQRDNEFISSKKSIEDKVNAYQKVTGLKGEKSLDNIRQLDKNGNPTGNLLSEYKYELFAERQDLINKIKRSKDATEKATNVKRYIEFKKANYYQMNESTFRNKSSDKFTEEDYNKQARLIEQYESDKEVFGKDTLMSFQTVDGEWIGSTPEEKAQSESDYMAAMSEFDNQNSPYSYWRTHGQYGNSKYVIDPRPKEIWKDSRFAKLGKTDREFLDYVNNTIQEYASNLPNELSHNLRDGSIPSYLKDIKGLKYLKTLPDEAKRLIAVNLHDSVDENVFIGEDKYSKVNVQGVSKGIKPENKSFDIGAILTDFAETTLHYKHANEIAPLLEATDALLGESHEAKMRASGQKTVKNLLGQTVVKENGMANAKEHLRFVLNKELYKIARKPEFVSSKKVYDSIQKKELSDLKTMLETKVITQAQYDEAASEIGMNVAGSKMIDSVIKWTYLKALSFPNIAAPATRRGLSIATSLTHAASGVDFNTKEYLHAMSIVTSSVSKTLGSKFHEDNLRKTYAWMEQLGVLHHKYESPYSGKKSVAEMLTILTEKGEFMNQGETVIACLLHHKLLDKNNKPVSVWDAYKVVDGRLEWDTAKMGEQTEMQKDAYVNKDGKNVNMYRLERYTSAVNYRIHGDYKNAMLAKESSIGRALTLFRTFLPQFVESRFGNEVNDPDLLRMTKGRYRSYMNMKDVNGNTLGITDMLKVVGKSLANARLFTGKSAYEGLSAVDAENMSRNMRELKTIGLFVTSALILQSITTQNEEEKRGINLVVNMMNRVNSEISLMVDPSSMLSILGKDPVSIVKTLSDFEKLMPLTIQTINGNGYYAAGTYKDMPKLGVGVLKQLPVGSGILSMLSKTKQIIKN